MFGAILREFTVNVLPLDMLIQKQVGIESFDELMLVVMPDIDPPLVAI